MRVLEGVASQGGKPQTIRVDNGPEFISRSLDLWAYSSGVKLDFSRPGKPTDNAFIESFNGWLRDECLNQHWFLSLDEARAVTEAWRADYNRAGPHGALGNQTPFEFARPLAGHAQLTALHGSQAGWYQVGGSVSSTPHPVIDDSWSGLVLPRNSQMTPLRWVRDVRMKDGSVNGTSVSARRAMSGR